MTNHWHLGKIVSVDNLAEGIALCREIGLETLQLRTGDTITRDRSQIPAVKALLRDFPAETLAAGWCGPAIWNNVADGHRTLGIGPKATRENRMQSLLCAIEWAAELEIPRVQTHFGYVPEDPSSVDYAEHVECLRRIGKKATDLGILFCLETGQETPITLRRLIEDCGEKSIGVNLDPANLLMYGKANPSDAVDILGKHIASMHVKDGRYPGADSHSLGVETKIGEGLVDFPVIFKKLHALGFAGPLIIEREIPQPQQNEDIIACLPLLKKWMDEA